MVAITGTIKSGGSAIAASYFPADWVIVVVGRILSTGEWAISSTSPVDSSANFTFESNGFQREMRIMACQPFGRPWEAGLSVASGDYVHKSTGLDGVVFRAGGSGTTHASTEPTWDTTHGNTTADNGITWTAVEYLSMSANQGPHIHSQYGDYSFALEQLFSGCKAGWAYDFTNLDSLYQDTSGTVPCTADADDIKYATDLSGNGNHSSWDSTTVVDSSGGISFLRMPSGGFIQHPVFPATAHILAVVDTESDAQGLMLYNGAGGTKYLMAYSSSSGGYLSSSVGSPTTKVDGGTVASTLAMYNALIASGGQPKVVTVENMTTGTLAYRTGNYGFSFDFAGKIYAFIVRDTAFTTDEITSVRTYLGI